MNFVKSETSSSNSSRGFRFYENAPITNIYKPSTSLSHEYITPINDEIQHRNFVQNQLEDIKVSHKKDFERLEQSINKVSNDINAVAQIFHQYITNKEEEKRVGGGMLERKPTATNIDKERLIEFINNDFPIIIESHIQKQNCFRKVNSIISKLASKLLEDQKLRLLLKLVHFSNGFKYRKEPHKKGISYFSREESNEQKIRHAFLTVVRSSLEDSNLFSDDPDYILIIGNNSF